MCLHALSFSQAVLYKTYCYSYGWKILKQTIGGVFYKSFVLQRLPPPSSSLFFTVAQLTAAAPTHKHKNINLLISLVFREIMRVEKWTGRRLIFCFRKSMIHLIKRQIRAKSHLVVNCLDCLTTSTFTLDKMSYKYINRIINTFTN